MKSFKIFTAVCMLFGMSVCNAGTHFTTTQDDPVDQVTGTYQLGQTECRLEASFAKADEAFTIAYQAELCQLTGLTESEIASIVPKVHKPVAVLTDQYHSDSTILHRKTRPRNILEYNYSRDLRKDISIKIHFATRLIE